MSIDTVRDALLWCTVINYSVLLVWFVFYMTPHEWLYGIWGRWFRLTPEQFDAVNFAAIALYKIGIVFFNLVPYIALRLVR
jgi:hypothetical protein